jgi:hypothetical protein
MSLNESHVEEAALEWFLLRSAPLNYGGQVGEQRRVTPTLIPAFSQREKGKEREAIRRLNFSIPEEARATHKESLSVQIERRFNP